MSNLLRRIIHTYVSLQPPCAAAARTAARVAMPFGVCPVHSVRMSRRWKETGVSCGVAPTRGRVHSASIGSFTFARDAKFGSSTAWWGTMSMIAVSLVAARVVQSVRRRGS